MVVEVERSALIFEGEIGILLAASVDDSELLIPPFISALIKSKF